jgi:radical SAM protein with 4Fe4S-binding SPASM domain
LAKALSTLVEATGEHGVSLLLATATPPCQLPASLRHLCNRCSFGFDKFYIDVDGNVLVCGMLRERLGNLLDAPPPGALGGENTPEGTGEAAMAKLLRRSPVFRRYAQLRHVPERCRECTDFDRCGGGCRAAAYASGGALDAMDELPAD